MRATLMETAVDAFRAQRWTRSAPDWTASLAQLLGPVYAAWAEVALAEIGPRSETDRLTATAATT